MYQKVPYLSPYVIILKMRNLLKFTTWFIAIPILIIFVRFLPFQIFNNLLIFYGLLLVWTTFVIKIFFKKAISK